MNRKIFDTMFITNSFFMKINPESTPVILPTEGNSASPPPSSINNNSNLVFSLFGKIKDYVKENFPDIIPDSPNSVVKIINMVSTSIQKARNDPHEPKRIFVWYRKEADQSLIDLVNEEFINIGFKVSMSKETESVETKELIQADEPGLTVWKHKICLVQYPSLIIKSEKPTVVLVFANFVL